MICPKCNGAEFVRPAFGAVADIVPVCPECQGSGIVSCCDTAGAQSVTDYALAEQGYDPYLKPEDYWAEVEGLDESGARDHRACAETIGGTARQDVCIHNPMVSRD